jgi:membrane-anchored mycosin MYCP
MTEYHRLMWRNRWVVAAVAVLAVAALTAFAPPARAEVRAADTCVEAGERIEDVPWQQELLDPEGAWAFTRGDGVTVAVLGSGVDGQHPQLGDRVLRGFDALAGYGAANTDCLGTGTQVAGVIAAQQKRSIGLVGLAPWVRILPVRVVDNGRDPVEPTVLARGIEYAVGAGAQVVVVATPSYADRQELRAAVADAARRDAIVVAAVGDRGGPDDGNPTPYPAAYDGVVGVGAIARTGERWPNSAVGPYVDIVAPGVEVLTLQREAGMAVVSGTGVAAGVVGGALALGRSKRGDSVTPSRLVRIMLATANPAPLGPGYGAGVVNPTATVAGHVSTRTPVAMPEVAPRIATEPQAYARSRRAALLGAGIAAAVVVLVLLLAATLPRGRRRWWRPLEARPVPREELPEETGPPLMLFDERRL